MEIKDILVIGFCMIYLVFLYVYLAGKRMRLVPSSRFLFVVPFFVAAFHIAMTDLEVCLLGLYIGVILSAGCFFLKNEKNQKRLCIIAGLCILATVIPCLKSPQYRCPHYTEEFEKGFYVMKEHYVLSEYKEIDWDSLYKKYIVLFQKADAKKDLNQAYDAWRSFTNEFHDAHVYSMLEKNDDAANEIYMKNHAGNDYGFCLVTLADGRTVFANVDEKSEAYAEGIRDGLSVTAFNGICMDKAKKDADIWFLGFPDKENEAFYRSLAVTCLGEEKISVTYKDRNGKEQTVELSQQGNHYERFKETKKELSGYKERTNLSYEMVSEDTACLFIQDMMVNPLVKFGATEDEDKYGGLKAKLIDQIEKMKAEGATKLIIDLRSNPGGYLDMSMAMAALFTSEECFAAAEGQYNKETGQYEIVDSVNLKPENVWGDGDIVLLVNAETASAAELFVYFMGKLPNVTIMGMTKSVGSAMGVNGYHLERFILYFPMILMLDENAEVLIDSDTSGISNMPLDVKIPLDDKAFQAIFEKHEDYVINYAVEYLASK